MLASLVNCCAWVALGPLKAALNRPLAVSRDGAEKAPSTTGTVAGLAGSSSGVMVTLPVSSSVTIVYALEIVKLANPRIRRREAREREVEQRKSA